MFSIDLPRAVLGFVGVHLGLRAEVAHLNGCVMKVSWPVRGGGRSFSPRCSTITTGRRMRCCSPLSSPAIPDWW
jgi:hypothetical protein